MLRRIQISAPTEQVDSLLQEIKGMEGVASIQLERGVSEHPKGDLLSIEALSPTYLRIMDLLEDRDVGKSSSSSITISNTSAVISPMVRRSLGRQSSASAWEQMQAVIAKESNMTAYALSVMFISGVFAAVGLTTGALHIVIAAMIVAPGFEPIIRMPLGWVVQGATWRRGAIDTLIGYVTLVLGAALGSLLLATTATPLLSEGSAYLSVPPLISYWTTVSLSSIILAFAGGFAGALLIATDRSVLTSGVMVALALIPSAAIVGVALGAGDLELMVRALGRWAVEVLVVIVSSVCFWLIYRARAQKRKSML